jgi:alcohol dehydrogenase class IV
MHRSGAGLKNPNLNHRMEYFDPKTRPQAVFLDEEALASAPADLFRSTSTTVFASHVAAMSATDINPLAEASRNHAFRLAFRSYPRLADAVDDPALRQDFAIAALLQDRAEDDGAPRYRGGAFAGNYAVSTALHVRYPHVGQGESTSVVHATKIRLTDTIDPAAARQVAQALEVWRDGMDASQAGLAVADRLEDFYTRAGLPTRLRQLAIPRDELQTIADETVKNFNFNPGMRSADDQIRDALRLLEAAY